MNATEEPDGFAAYETWLGTPLPADPIAAMRILRRQAEQEVERLLAFLDAIDGNPDLEDDGGGIGDNDGAIEQLSGEPSLGWPLYGPSVLDPSHWLDVDVELDEADAEPSLASPEGAKCPDNGRVWGGYVSRPDPQTSWARGNSADFEGDATEDDEDGHDAEDDKSDYEPDVEGEPNGNDDASDAPDDPKYAAAPSQRRNQVAGVPVQRGFANVDMSRAMPVVNGCAVRPHPLEDQNLTMINEVGEEMRVTPDGRIVR